MANVEEAVKISKRVLDTVREAALDAFYAAAYDSPMEHALNYYECWLWDKLVL